jgi:CRISPR/Cas system CMR subunit Cmr4 (Cas7 group RAMP superfamily)
MILLLNPLLEGLETARRAAADAIHPDDEVTVDDQGAHWVFEFIPRGDVLGGGARVSIAKDKFRVLKVVRGQ